MVLSRTDRKEIGLDTQRVCLEAEQNQTELFTVMSKSFDGSRIVCRPHSRLCAPGRFSTVDPTIDATDRFVLVRRDPGHLDGPARHLIERFDEVGAFARRVDRTTVTFAEETTMAGHHRLAALATGVDDRVAVLIFASAKNPGGGYTSGASAQEESVARLGALAWVQQRAGGELYACNARDNRRCVYESAVIYSPDVPFFKDEAGNQCPRYLVDTITSAAPNATYAGKRGATAQEITAAILERVDLILASAANARATHLVLGAWGCGVFGNDESTVVNAFRDALNGPYAGIFTHVHFAVVGRCTREFAAAFGTSAKKR